MSNVENLHITYEDYKKLHGAEISFELSQFLVGLIERLPKDAVVVDLGSGWTSYLIRKLNPNVNVWTVDDHEGWMAKTTQFCQENNVSTQGFILLCDAKTQIQPASVDLIIHDLGNRETRGKELKWILSLAKPGAIVILDDMHKQDLRASTEDRLQRSGLSWEKLEQSIDLLGRFAYLVMIPSKT